MLGEDGQKMSKSKRNYREPNEIFTKYGADALRWYFFAKQPPWTEIRYREQSIRDSIPEFILRLWNVFGFLVNYANADGFDPVPELPHPGSQLNPNDLAAAKSYRAIPDRGELDRWVLSELNLLIRGVADSLDRYDSYGACQQINRFVDSLSNWYVRRSRDRFWSNDKRAVEKLDAYWTLYECLLSLSKVIAPFVPFLSETIWRNLTAGWPAGVVKPSVHLTDFPLADESAIDVQLSQQMDLLREIASLGRAARMEAKLKVRQPLQRVTVALSSIRFQSWLQSHDAILRDELNVKQVDYIADAAEFVSYEIQPNFKKLGPQVGKLLPALKQALANVSGADLLQQLQRAGQVKVDVAGTALALGADDIQVRLKAKPGWAAAQGPDCVVILATELTPELIQEGIVRDVVRIIQELRKKAGLDYQDRIVLQMQTDDLAIREAVTQGAEFICGETLAQTWDWTPVNCVHTAQGEVGESEIVVGLTKWVAAV